MRSHLFWQQMDPVAVVQDLGPLVVHAAAKDVRVVRRPPSTGCWTTGSADAGRAADQPRRRRVGDEVAEGHRLGLRRTGPGPRLGLLVDLDLRLVCGRSMWVNIEHEDTSLGRIEGLEVATGCC